MSLLPKSRLLAYLSEGVSYFDFFPVGETSRSRCNTVGETSRARFSRSAGALGYHTRMRAGFRREHSSTVFYRIAGACPPRCPASSGAVLGPLGPEEKGDSFFRSANAGEGQALALR